MATHPQCGHQLFDIEATLIACEREHHEVTHFNVVLFEHAGKRVLGSAKPLERFLAN